MTTVLALVTEAFGGRGGIAQYNRDLLRVLAEKSTVSTITVLPRNAPDQPVAPAKVTQAPPRTRRLVYAIGAVLTALQRHIDVVFSGHLYMAPLACLVARLKGAKLVVQMHGVEAWSRPSRLRQAATEAADLVFCVSRYTRGRVIGWAALEPERVVIVPDTVGEAFTPDDGSALRASLGILDKCVLLTVGRMDSRECEKGHDRLIAAIPGLVLRGHDIVYLIVGAGDDQVRLEGLAHHHGVADRVRFLGAISPGALPGFYRIADLFVMPSAQEGFGIAFLEAMACGTPALGLDVGGARDPLADGELGILVPEGDLLGALDRALSRPRPDPQMLAAKADARFGRGAFAAHISRIFA